MTSSNSAPISGPLALTLNGHLHIGEETANVKIAVSDRGFLLGDGVFETLPILNGHALWVEQHLDRMLEGASRIDLPISKRDLSDAIAPLINWSKGQNTILRITLSRGSGGRGLTPPQTPTPTILAALAPFPLSMAFDEVSMVTATIRRNESSPTSKLKSLNYLDNILASQEAARLGAGDALLLNSQGNAACTTMCNLFAISGDTIVTPPLHDGVLNGILRSQMLSIAPSWGFSIIERSLTPSQLKKADGLFLTNSLRIIRRVNRLDDHPFELGKPGDDIISRLQHLMDATIHSLTGVSFLDARA